MEMFLVVLVIIAIVVAYIYAGKLKSKAISSINRKVQSRTHEEGIDLVNSTLFFPIGAPVVDVVAALLGGVRVENQSIVLENLSRGEVGSDTINWVYGKKFFTSFEATVLVGVEVGLSDGTKQRGVVLSIHDAHTIDGVVHGVKPMKALVHDVEKTLKSIDPNTELTVIDS